MIENTASRSLPIKDRVVLHLKAWPQEIKSFFKSPQAFIVDLPKEGPWDKPFTYIGASTVAMGLVQFLQLARFAPSYGVSAFFTTVIGGVIGFPILAFVLNLIFGAVKKEPGFYRTVSFFAVLSVVGPVVTILGSFLPLLALTGQLFGLYALFMFSQAAAAMSKKEAVITIAIIGALTVLPLLLVGSAAMFMGGI